MNTMLVVCRGSVPRPAPLAGGGFRWSQSVTLLRGGQEIASATAWEVTHRGDSQSDTLWAENQALASLARPGDTLLVEGSTSGNGSRQWRREFIVASPMGKKRTMLAELGPRMGKSFRPQGMDPLEMAGESRPFRAEILRYRRKTIHAANLAALKAAAISRRMCGENFQLA